jgi:diketogulonate reductase-like aldo/keto reductase
MPHPTVTLNNGAEMPMLGFGTWQLRGDAEATVAAAIEAGFRHVDTASMYGNELGVGAGVRRSGVPRSEVFVTTKIWNNDHGYERSRRAVDASRERLGLGAIDLVLIHWPGGHDRLETWRQLEEQVEAGTVRSIGVSNYDVGDIEELLEVATVRPAVNQIEFNPFMYRQQRPVLDRCDELGIQVCAWQPLMQGRNLNHPVIKTVAGRLGRSPAQVLLRWSIQRGVVPLPKSSTLERIRENARIFDFELSPRDMESLDGLS